MNITFGLKKIDMKKLNKKCEICGNKFHGTYRKEKIPMFLCAKHLHQMVRHGEIQKRTITDKNEIINKGIYSEVILYNRKSKEVSRTLIDSDLIDIISKYKWVGVKKGKSVYVKTDVLEKGEFGEKRKTLYLSALILGEKKGFQIDHISGNTLDNRKRNLRHVTQQQNLMNKINALGISKTKRGL